MKKLTMAISIAALLLTLWAAFAYANGRLTEPATNQLLLWSSLVWFLAAPFWMGVQNK